LELAKTTRKPAAKSSTKSAVKRKPASRSKKPVPLKASVKSKSRGTSQGLSPERKKDIIAVIMGLVGILAFLSMVTSQQGAITDWVVDILHQAAGWGAFFIPIILVVSAVLILTREHIDLPMFSTGRKVGVILLIFNLLGWFHIFAGGGWLVANAGLGGGYLGGVVEWALVKGLGMAGAVILMAAWFLISIILIFKISVPELIAWLKKTLAEAIKPVEERLNTRTDNDWHPETVIERVVPPDDAEYEDPPDGFQAVDPQLAEKGSTSVSQMIKEKKKKSVQVEPVSASIEETSPIQVKRRTSRVRSVWKLPVIDQILDPATPVAIRENVDQDRARLIEETLGSFGVPVHVVDIQRGPTVTRFGVEPDFITTRTGRTRVRVSKIVSLADDLALALAAPRIRIQAPVPGKSFVGIEVPNEETSRVTLREILETPKYKRMRSPLRFALGKDVAGKPIAASLPSMPHLLIAGTTGSGKSVCINSILTCFLMSYPPTDLRLVLVDPKRVELTGYNGVPHLLAPVVVDAERVIGALQWMLREMDSRYHKFSKEGVRNVQEYNNRHPDDNMPYLLIVIDELADLMMLAPDQTERAITRLAQLARATGIHLIIATQRPSTDVVTGVIKANFPARVAFAVASGVDSRVILDQPGAERLLGRGDMLFQAPDASAPVRLQGVYVSDSETQRLVDYWKTTAATVEETQPISTETISGSDIPLNAPLKQVPLFDEAPDPDEDPLMQEAVDIVRRQGRASITMLQRRLRIGYTRSARIVDKMEEKGIIGPPTGGTQVREVLDYGEAAPPAGEE